MSRGPNHCSRVLGYAILCIVIVSSKMALVIFSAPSFLSKRGQMDPIQGYVQRLKGSARDP